MVSLKRKAFLGSIWTFAGFGLGQFCRLISNLILTRLLVPEFFGIMTIVNSLRIGFILLSDFGIKQSIVHNKRGYDPVFFNTAWTIEIIRGFVLFLLCCLFAIPAVHLYGETSFYWLMPVVGLAALIKSFQSTALINLQRQVNVGKAVIFNLIVQILSLCVMVIWAFISPSLAALAAGTIAGAIFSTLGSYFFLAKTRNRLMIDRQAVAEIFSFGKWLFIATTLVFLAEQSDRLILGNLLPLSVLGVYGIALNLANIPRQVLKKLANQIIFPVVSRRAELPRKRLRTEILPHRQKLLLIFAAMLLPLIVGGDTIILTLYDDRYIQATWMLPMLALGVWFSVLFYTSNPCLMGIGKPMYGAFGNLLRFLVISIGLFVGFNYGGIFGVVLVVVVSEFLAYVGIQFGLAREKLLFLSQDLGNTFLLVGVSATLIGIRAWLGWGGPLGVL